MSYSLAQAAAATGLNKTTLLRSIKSGRLTGTKDALGQWQIDPAELHRVYPPNIAQRHAAPQAAAVLEAQHRAELAEQRSPPAAVCRCPCRPRRWLRLR